MAPLNDLKRDMIKEALAEQMRKEPFERALGKVLRRRGLDFEVYISIMSDVREEAKKLDLPLEETAKIMSSNGPEIEARTDG